MNKVDIIVPVYNAIEFVEPLLISIAQSDFGDLVPQVIIVDDASDQETAEALLRFSRQNERVTLLRNEKNSGYTKTLNRGIRAGQGTFVLQCNSDCLLPKEAIKKLSQWLIDDNTLFAVSPLSNAASWQSIPYTLTESGALAVNDLPAGLTLEQVDRAIENFSTGLAEGELLNGFCVMYRRELLEQVGLPDEEAFPRGYGEEDDLHFRAANLGFRLAVATNTYVYHAKTKSFASDERDSLVRLGRKVLNERYGEARIQRAAASMRYHPQLQEARSAISAITPASLPAVIAYSSMDWENAAFNRDNELISLLMPVYSNGEMTLRAIESIMTSARTRYELLVVNNGADPTCSEILRKAAPKHGFRLIETGQNLNFSMACNIGFFHSRGGKVIFINNDMIFNDHNWITSISRTLDLKDAGAAGIKLLYEDSTIQSCGIKWYDKSFFPTEYGRGWDANSVSGLMTFPAITGACFGMHAADFAALRGFDPLFVNGSEDLDLCLKIGFFLKRKCYLDACSSAIHLEGKSPGRGTHTRHNRMIFYKRWSGYVGSLADQSPEKSKATDHFPLPLRKYEFG